MANLPRSHYLDIGVLGEEIVAQWLQSQGWIILHRRWRCRWGEIDIVAKLDLHYKAVEGQRSTLAEGKRNHHSPSISLSSHQPTGSTSHLPLIAFVEVKTRSPNNWDAGGLLAITPKKQAKLWQTAQCFLTTYPDLAQYPCRFDVALVSYHKLGKQSGLSKSSISIEALCSLSSIAIELGQSITIGNYQLLLQEYLPSAFD